jgi:hypothetical protein
MKSKLISYYKMFFNTYYFVFNYNEEKSRNYAYYAIRNMIGVVIFMLLLVIYVVVTCMNNINLNLKGNRSLLYLFMAVLVFSFLSVTKKHLKPIFGGIQLESEKASKKYFIITLVIVGIFGSGVYAIPRLLHIYLCR